MNQRLLLVLVALAGFGLGGCEVSVGSGNFDGGFFDGDGDSGDGDSGDGDTSGDGDSGDGDTSGDGDSGDGDDEDSGMPGDGDSGDGDMGDGDSGDGDSVAMLPKQMAEKICAAREACVGVERLANDLDGNSCVEQTEAMLADGMLASLQLSIDTDLVAYDASALATCLTDIGALGCDWQTTRWPASCDAALGGTVADGDACNGHFDCAGDAYCDYGALPTCPGTCVARASESGTCTSDAGCKNGLVCAAGVCVVPGVSGTVCDQFDSDPVDAAPCAAGYECFRETSGSNITVCKAISEVYDGLLDDACDPFVGELCTADLSKDLNLVCSSGSNTCERAKLANDPCDRGKPDPCPLTQYCNDASNLCREREIAGATCIVGRGKMCAAGTICVDDTCVSVNRVGESCTVDEGCHSGNCNETTETCEPSVVCE